MKAFPDWVTPIHSGHSLHFPFVALITLVIKKLLCSYLFMPLSQLNHKLHKPT